jgi:hypothetical protein
MTPLGSVTWNARSPQGSSRSGMVMRTPSARRRASHLLPEAEVAGQEGRRGGHVGDVEGYGGSGDLHGQAPRGGASGGDNQ